jgi:hypothetical protein
LSTLFAAGSGHFDQFQPDQFQLGIASLNPSVPNATSAGAALTESSRAELTGNGIGKSTPGTIVTDPLGATLPGQGPTLPAGNPNNALGNVDQSLALITGRVTDATTGNVVNQVSLYSSTNFAKTGSINLHTSDVLTDISGTFRPSLAGTALVDVQGNTQSFRALTAKGLVFNGEGVVNLVKIQSAVDSTIIGFPFGHAQIPFRQNVTILSSTRAVAGRNGVNVLPNLKPTGPLSLPFD